MVTQPVAWQSIYQKVDAKNADAISIAEHTKISDMTLKQLDPSGLLFSLFGRKGVAGLKVVDLNASLFRRDSLYLKEPFGDDENTLVEERLIPPPALFAGIPDYSYGIYDWLNKNRTCPAFKSAVYEEKCHDFKGWLGALNSVHFGSQAKQMYAHLHMNAVSLAKHAAAMSAAMNETEREAYSDVLKEAALLALAYEGYAQHFLQDRWAVGHMWERWNAPDPRQEEASLIAHLAIGAIAGMIHGAEAVVRETEELEFLLEKADPMSSPVPGPPYSGGSQMPKSQPMQFSRDGISVWDAIGDERLSDARNGIFSLNSYKTDRVNQRLDVQKQLEKMLQCAGAGWAEVVRALGPGSAAGTYSAFRVGLAEDAPSFKIIEQDDCWNMWATNRSMMIGLLGPNAHGSLLLLSKVDLVPLATALDATQLEKHNRSELVRHAAQLWLWGTHEPNGIEMATAEAPELVVPDLNVPVGDASGGRFGSLWGFKPGSAYNLPDYLVPIGLGSAAASPPANTAPPALSDPLPAKDPRGRDVYTLYGAFNGAMAGHWCEDRSVLLETRDDPTPLNQEICLHLSERLYQGTHPTYQGKQKQTRTFNGTEIGSLCSLVAKGSVEGETSDDQANPFWLDQGYVPKEVDDEAQDSPDDSETAAAFPLEPVKNWCGRTPTVHLSRDDTLRRDNVAARVDPEDELLQLDGVDFGMDEGTVRLTGPGNRVIDLVAFEAWSNNRIIADLTEIELELETDYEIDVTAVVGPNAPRKSVGLFYLRVSQGVDLSGLYRSQWGDVVKIQQSPEDRRAYTASISTLGTFLGQRKYAVGEELMTLTQVRKTREFAGRVGYRYRPGLVERCGLTLEELPMTIVVTFPAGVTEGTPTEILASWRHKDPEPGECGFKQLLTRTLELTYVEPLP
ncbi:MAG: hypothetical protein ACE363_15805 [Alphaproteobacteria bacterium]